MWIIYLTVTSAMSPRTIHFYDVMTGEELIDVSGQYISEIPLLRYFFEPFVGLTFIFTFNSDPTEILVLFLVVYLIIRVALLTIDNTILNRNRRKEVIFRYIKNVLEFVTKYASIMIGIVATIIVIGLFTQGFLWVANYFCLLFHIASIIGFFLLIGKSIYNAVIYFHPKFTLKVKKISGKSSISKVLIRFRRESFYFLTAFLLIFSLNFVFLGIKFPTHSITAVDLGPDEFLFDFHVHTTMSDGHLTPEQRVKWYIEQGIHGAAFTDHHHPRGAQQAKAYVEANNLSFIVFVGQEYSDNPEGLHINLFGIEDAIIPENYYYEGPYHYSEGPGPMNVSEAINWTKENGGYVIVNHYDRNASAPFSYEQLRDWGVDGFEVSDNDKYREIYNFCKDNNLICLGGTDEHMNGEVDEFVRLKLTDPNNKTLDHIFENLRRNNHSCIVMSMHTYYDNYDDPFEKLDDFNNYLANLDEYQVISWVIWSCIAYAAIMLVLYRVKKKDLVKLKEKIEEI